MKSKITGFILSLLVGIMMFTVPVFADTDEILNYTIFIDVNEDATLNINYHIDWKVLDSGSGVGPLTWMKIGIPNSHVIRTEGLSSTVDHINRSGNYVEVYLDKSYYEGDVASVDFLVVQDYMYQVNKYTEGETVYNFTAGWFDDIKVDNLTIGWNNDKVLAFTPSCFIEGDYNVWKTQLGKGERHTVEVTYPNDAFAFDLSKSSEEDKTSFIDIIGTIIGLFFALIVFIIPFAIPIIIAFAFNRGFKGNSPTITKTTRVKVTYFDSCPSCGAPRKEGAKFCEFCGKSLVKSEETITEEQLKKEEKEAAAFTKNGEYRYGSSPNVFLRVNSVSVPNPNYRRPSSSGRSSSYHSSCAHSSCACACACACAGGGRAGCTAKDFYNTNLKLTALAKACGKKESKG